MAGCILRAPKEMSGFLSCCEAGSGLPPSRRPRPGTRTEYGGLVLRRRRSRGGARQGTGILGAADRCPRYRPRLHPTPSSRWRPRPGPRTTNHSSGRRSYRRPRRGRACPRAPGAQDLHRPVEVDVGDLGAFDLLVRSRVETGPPVRAFWCKAVSPFPVACLRRMIANRVLTSQCDFVLFVSASVQEKRQDIMRMRLQTSTRAVECTLQAIVEKPVGVRPV
jgi:hypothetical protein